MLGIQIHLYDINPIIRHSIVYYYVNISLILHSNKTKRQKQHVEHCTLSPSQIRYMAAANLALNPINECNIINNATSNYRIAIFDWIRESFQYSKTFINTNNRCLNFSVNRHIRIVNTFR